MRPRRRAGNPYEYLVATIGSAAYYTFPHVELTCIKSRVIGIGDNVVLANALLPLAGEVGLQAQVRLAFGRESCLALDAVLERCRLAEIGIAGATVHTPRIPIRSRRPPPRS